MYLSLRGFLKKISKHCGWSTSFSYLSCPICSFTMHWFCIQISVSFVLQVMYEWSAWSWCVVDGTPSWITYQNGRRCESEGRLLWPLDLQGSLGWRIWCPLHMQIQIRKQSRTRVKGLILLNSSDSWVHKLRWKKIVSYVYR